MIIFEKLCDLLIDFGVKYFKTLSLDCLLFSGKCKSWFVYFFLNVSFPLKLLFVPFPNIWGRKQTNSINVKHSVMFQIDVSYPSLPFYRSLFSCMPYNIEQNFLKCTNLYFEDLLNFMVCFKFWVKYCVVCKL